MFVAKEEIYSWVPEGTDKTLADAEIPDELGNRLQEALNNYRKVAEEINEYIIAHPWTNLT